METGMCVNSRITGGANVWGERDSRNSGMGSKRMLRIFGRFLLVVVLAAVSFGSASAALPPPNFMPGFPLVAGPQIIFMWAPVMGAEKYRIYLDGKSVAESTAFQHILALPTEGDHAYYVVAVDKDGKESPPGKTFSYAVKKLGIPKNVSVMVRENKLALRWDPVKDAIVYDVHRGAAPGGPFQLIGSTQDQSFVDPKVKAGETFHYRVTAKDATGTSSGMSEPALGKIEAAVEAKAERKLQIVKTKLMWESRGLENATEALYLPNGDIAVATPITFSGSQIIVIKNAGTPQEIRTVISPPAIELPPAEGAVEAPKIRFGGMGLSSDGSIWVTSSLTPHILRVDPESKRVVETLVIDPIPNTVTPYSFIDVAEGPGGDLFVVDQKNTLVMVIRKGKIVSTIASRGNKPGELAAPNTIVASGNEIFISDVAQGSVNVFGTDGKFHRRIGSYGGRDPGTFSRMTGIAVVPAKKWIYVGDRATSNIQILDLADGKFVAMLANEDGTGQPRTNPVGLDVRGDTILVSWQNGNLVQEFKFLGPPVDR